MRSEEEIRKNLEEFKRELQTAKSKHKKADLVLCAWINALEWVLGG